MTFWEIVGVVVGSSCFIATGVWGVMYLNKVGRNMGDGE